MRLEAKKSPPSQPTGFPNRAESRFLARTRELLRLCEIAVSKGGGNRRGVVHMDGEVDFSEMLLKGGDAGEAATDQPDLRGIRKATRLLAKDIQAYLLKEPRSPLHRVLHDAPALRLHEILALFCGFARFFSSDRSYGSTAHWTFASLFQPRRQEDLLKRICCKGHYLYSKLNQNLSLENDFILKVFNTEKLDASKDQAGKKFKVFLPAVIKGWLDEAAVGQDAAKRALAAAVWRHTLAANGEAGLPRTSVLLLGPTGCGKTFLCQALARRLKLPFVSFSATQLSANGYVGAGVEDILVRLIKAADNNVELAKKGIVFIDEFDKLRVASVVVNSAGEGNRDIKGRCVQEELLTVIEGSKIQVTIRGGMANYPDMETGGILFILGGAFTGLSKIRDLRLGRGKRPLGFAKGNNSASQSQLAYSGADLEAFGLIPELVGRLGAAVELHPLGEAEMRQILGRPETGLLEPYTRLLKKAGWNLEWDDKFLRAMAQKAVDGGLGARGLKAQLEDLVRPAFFSEADQSLGTLRLTEGEDGEPCMRSVSGVGSEASNDHTGEVICS